MSLAPPLRGRHGPLPRSSSPRPAFPTRPSTTKVIPGKEPAHLPLHRRLLFAQYPPDKALPPIIKGLGASKEIALLNERLYHLLALILRGYVLSWYPRFTKDRTLLPVLSRTVILPILQPILQGIYDDPSSLANLILLDLPTILELHIKTYWESRASLALNLPPADPSRPTEVKLGEAYHARLALISVLPSPAAPSDTADPATSEEENAAPYRIPVLSGQYVVSPLYLSALADGILAKYLPKEEYKIEVERSIAQEIIARAVLSNVAKRMCEPWTYWSLLLKLLGPPRATSPPRSTSSSGTPARRAALSLPHILMLWLFGLWDVALLFWRKAIGLMALYSASPPLDARYVGTTDAWLALARVTVGVDGREGLASKRWALRLIWGAIEVIVNLCGGYIDRLLPHLVHTTLLTPKVALRVTDLMESILFPNGYPSASPPDPSPEEMLVMRESLEARIAEIISPGIRDLVLPAPGGISQLLDPISSAGCNAHLFAMLLDGIVRALAPDMAMPVHSEPPDCNT